MDEADIAQAHIEQSLELALRRVPRGPSLLPMGACHYCGEATTRNQLFCNLECSEDFEYERRQRARAQGETPWKE